MCHVQFETLRKHSQHPKKQKYKDHPKPKIPTNNTKTGEKSLRSSCEGFDNRTLPREFRLSAFLIAWVLVWIRITRCPWLYYRIQLSMVFGKTFKRLKILLPLEQNHFLQVCCALEQGNLQRGAHYSHLLQPWKENTNSHHGGLSEHGQCFQRKALGKKCNKFMWEKKKFNLWGAWQKSRSRSYAFMKPFPIHRITVSNPGQTHSQMDQNCGLLFFPPKSHWRTEKIYLEKKNRYTKMIDE